MTLEIRIPAASGGFAEDKDQAKLLRENKILPALERGDTLVLDFAEVLYATQSFVHALIAVPLKKHGEEVLDRMVFKNCSPQMQSLIELVVDYSFEGFPEPARAAV